jgi:hypothetical protein
MPSAVLRQEVKRARPRARLLFYSHSIVPGGFDVMS